MTQISRRSLLKLGGAGALAALGVPSLAACGSGGGASTTSDSGGVAWPTYQRLEGPAADLRSSMDGGCDAFFRYPRQLATSVTEKPGDGSDVTAFVLTYSPPPAPVDDNRFWQAINEALGVNIKLTLVPVAEYSAKLATLMAAGDLPDIILIQEAPRTRDFVAAKCADLSEHLSGDAVKEYPNLANLATASWRTMGRINGGIYGIPLTRAIVGIGMHVNRTLFDSVNAPVDWTKDQFVTALDGVTKGRVYGLGASAADLAMDYHASSFGAPNMWRLDGDRLVSMYETPEYKAAVDFARQCFADGYYHPTSRTGTMTDIMNQYYAGNVGAAWGNFMNYATGIYIDRVGGRFTTDVAMPYGGGHWLGDAMFGYTVFKKASPERIKMLLRICNYLCAPYGTKEYELVNEGVEGVHFTRTDGGLQKTDLASTENKNSVPISRYICNAPEIINVPGKEQETRHAFEVQEALLKKGVTNPSLGYASATADRVSSKITQDLHDVRTGVVTGRLSMSDWDAAVTKWRDGGGAKIAEELTADRAANK